MADVISRIGEGEDLFEITFTGKNNDPTPITILGLRKGDTFIKVWQPSSPLGHIWIDMCDHVVTTDDQLPWTDNSTNFGGAVLKMIVARFK